MKDFECISKKDWPADKAKITIASNRVSLKVSELIEPENYQRLKKLAEKAKVQYFQQTLYDMRFTVRGSVGKNKDGYWVTLYTRSRYGDRTLVPVLKVTEN
jgi:hypothetical protein